MHYEIEYTTAVITMPELFEHLLSSPPEVHCEGCGNKGNLWSCPPFNFTAQEYLKNTSHALIVCGKIHAPGDEDLTNAYYEARNKFGDQLIELSHKANCETLIAGNCYLCESCTRPLGEPCRHPEDLKYSLEALGFNVNTLTKKLFDIEPQWGTSGNQPSYLLMVGAVLSNGVDLLSNGMNVLFDAAKAF